MTADADELSSDGPDELSTLKAKLQAAEAEIERLKAHIQELADLRLSADTEADKWQERAEKAERELERLKQNPDRLDWVNLMNERDELRAKLEAAQKPIRAIMPCAKHASQTFIFTSTVSAPIALPYCPACEEDAARAEKPE